MAFHDKTDGRVDMYRLYGSAVNRWLRLYALDFKLDR